MIRVLVCAETADELVELEEIIRESDSLQLVGSTVGYTRMNELVQEARPDVTLEQGAIDDSEEIDPAELSDLSVGRVLLVTEPEFDSALAGVRSSETAIRGVLPAWSSEWEIRAAIAAVAEGLLVLHPDFADRSLASPASPPRDVDPLAQALSPRTRDSQSACRGAGKQANRVATQHLRAHRKIPRHIDLQQAECLEPRGSRCHRRATWPDFSVDEICKPAPQLLPAQIFPRKYCQVPMHVFVTSGRMAPER